MISLLLVCALGADFKEGDIVFYSRANCIYCPSEENFLTTLGVNFIKIIDEVRTVPRIMLVGRERNEEVVGFNKRAIRDLLNHRYQLPPRKPVAQLPPRKPATQLPPRKSQPSEDCCCEACDCINCACQASQTQPITPQIQHGLRLVPAPRPTVIYRRH